MSRKTDGDSRLSAAMRADAALKAAVKTIEAEATPDRLTRHARKISGAPSGEGDKRN